MADDRIQLDAAPDAARFDAGRLDAAAAADWADWDSIPEPLQLMLADAALRRAAASIADQADTLAWEMETGTLQDRGGPEALRLLAALIRAATEGDPA
jgi:predicted lipoprotein